MPTRPNILTKHSILAQCPFCGDYAHVHYSPQPGPMQDKLDQIRHALEDHEAYETVKCSRCGKKFDLVPNEI